MYYFLYLKSGGEAKERICPICGEINYAMSQWNCCEHAGVSDLKDVQQKKKKEAANALPENREDHPD